MPNRKNAGVNTEHHLIQSKFLRRDVKVDCYLPANTSVTSINLLLINDGQDLVTMHFQHILKMLFEKGAIQPLFCVGIYCGPDRKNEYGTAKILDYCGRGTAAAFHDQFIFEELLPYLSRNYPAYTFIEKSYAGFSLGGLSALDIVWNYPHHFTKVGVFSGSLWWRDKDQDAEDFDESKNRIMHRQVREGGYAPWLSFFFEVGTQDETADRNNNGIIDAIDDTISLIEELKMKGYTDNNIAYLELQDGKHDVHTWARAFPAFLTWAFKL